jgi:hypothetical protein
MKIAGTGATFPNISGAKTKWTSIFTENEVAPWVINYTVN